MTGTLAILAATGLLATGLASGARTAPAAAAPVAPAAQKGPVQRSLAQVLAEPHGPAAGDKVMHRGRGPVTRPGADANSVNKGTKKQAAGVKLRRITKAQGQADALNVVTDSARTAGCVLGYGVRGQCLPTVPPGAVAGSPGAMAGMDHSGMDHSGAGSTGGTAAGAAAGPSDWDCSKVHSLFPSGIALSVRGTDPLRLDGNGDGTACGAGD